jgi:hypothetical protein
MSLKAAFSAVEARAANAKPYQQPRPPTSVRRLPTLLSGDSPSLREPSRDFSGIVTIPHAKASRHARRDSVSSKPAPKVSFCELDFEMMTRLLVRAACPIAAVLLSTSGLRSQEAPKPAPRADAWTISQPYPNNPLRQATVVGSVSVAGASREAELQIECRAPELPRMNLRFRSTSLQFDLDPFEGPPGIGQKRKLLQIELDGDPPRKAFFSGFYVESDIFVIGVAPQRSGMSRLVSTAAAAKSLHIQLSPADGKGDPLLFTFTLPKAAAPVEDVARPCFLSKAKVPSPNPK